MAPAQAQGAAVLTGKVVDAASKKGIVDVVVTVTSAALQGEQIVTTDKSGSYRVPSLPPGVYTLRLDKEGFRAYQRDQIQLRADATIRLDADLLPEGLRADEVVIVAHAPTVDIASSSTGTNINSDFVSRIPITNPGARGGAQRTFEAVAEATPGAQSDQYGTSINGSTSPENGYFIDGIRTNSAKFGTNGSPLSIEFVKEVNVLSGGYMPEYGRSTGGILNVVTKSGSNEYHGSMWANWTPGALEGARKYPYFGGSAIQTRRSLGNVFDVGFDQSGPIVKDKLWYYVGFGVSRAIYNLERSIWASDINPADGTTRGTSQLPGTTQNYQATQTSYQIFAKLDYRINQNNKLALTFAATPTSSGGGGDFSVNPQTGSVENATTGEFNLNGTYGAMARSYRSGAYDMALKWTTEFENKSKILETTVGWHHELGGRLSSDGFKPGTGLGYAGLPNVIYRRSPNLHGVEDFERTPAGCSRVTVPGQANSVPTCPSQLYNAGGADFIDSQVLDVYTAKSILTMLGQLAGHHVIKAGVELEMLSSWWSRGWSGGIRWREATGGGNFGQHRGYGYLYGPDQPIAIDRLTARSTSFQVGGFIQDSWQIMDKVTLNAGVRYDNQFLFGTDGKMLVALPNQVSPRLGLIFDPTQKGRAKIFANFARFYESVPLDLTDRQTGESGLNQQVLPSRCDPTDPRQALGVCNTDAARRRFPADGGYTASPDRKYGVIGGGKAVIDPDLSPQSSSEFVTGGEYELVKNGRIGASYTRRWMNNVVEDMSNDEGATYFIGNPGKGIGKGFPEATRNYDAGTVYFMKTFADTWLAQVSYTLSHLRGNIAGLYDPTTGQLDPNINATFDLRSLLVNQTGDLPGDSRHQFKIFGAKDFWVTKTSKLEVGGGINARSGNPTNYLGGHLNYGADTIHVLPRGTGDRLPWNANVTTHLGYNWKFENGMTLGITMDIFNLLNFQGETSRDNRYTGSDVNAIPNGTRADLPGKLTRSDGTAFDPALTHPNFGQANRYQEPRQFRFGIRGSF